MYNLYSGLLIVDHIENWFVANVLSTENKVVIIILLLLLLLCISYLFLLLSYYLYDHTITPFNQKGTIRDPITCLFFAISSSSLYDMCQRF